MEMIRKSAYFTPPAEDFSPMLFLDACKNRNGDRPPVWLMRQAGRYLPEYRTIRATKSFVEMCTDPDVAVEVSLQPFRRFGMDAVIVFYDILFLPGVMGAPLVFTDEGPRFERPLRTSADFDRLGRADLTSLDPSKGTGAILESLRRLRREVPREAAVLGFAGAPFTLAAYLVEGRLGQGVDRMRRFLNEEPRLAHRLLELLAQATGEYLSLQAAAGADALQLFDTWAGLLDRKDYAEFALPYEKIALEAVARAGKPSILFVNGCTHILEDMAASGASVLSLDWRLPLRTARERVGAGLGLQGNLDPAALFAAPDAVRQRTSSLLDAMSSDPGYVVNLGHGVLPETPPESVEAFVEAVKARKGVRTAALDPARGLP
jgi:uroporphyrinogen decarboxylase